MKLWKKLRTLCRRRQFEADLAEEVRLHREAVGAAAFGSEALALEQAREAWGLGWVDSAMQDVRYAVRCWRRSPGLALTVIGTIGLALGLNTTLFSVVNAYVLRPIAVRDPYSLYGFGWHTKDLSGHRFTWSEYTSLRGESRIFTSAIAFRTELVSLNHEPAFGQLVSGNFFSDLGGGMYLGRPLASEDRETIVLGNALWKSRFGADPLILGRKLYLGDRPVEVVGIANPEFTGLGSVPVEFWAPLALSSLVMDGPDLFGPQHPEQLTVVARLKQGLAPETAKAGLLIWARQMTAGKPKAQRAMSVYLEQHATMVPVSGGRLLAILPVFVVFGLVLVLACANVSNMMLARALARQREIGIRVSLGAGRARLVRQLLTESLLLAVPAAGAGFAISQITIGGAMRLLFATVPPAFGRLIHVADLTPDWRVFGFLLAASMAATLLFGLAPAVQTTRTRLVEANRGDFSSDYRPARLRSILVVTQVSVCALLLICAAVVLRSEQRVTQTELGLDTRQVIDFRVHDKYRARVAERLAREPLVEAVATDWRTPLYGSVRRIAVTPSGGRNAVPSGYNFVSPDYFRVFRIPVLAGRIFFETEGCAVMVSQTAARRFWPGDEALGQSIAIAPGPKERDPQCATARVVGIAADAVDGFAADKQNATGIYFPTSIRAAGNESILVRVRGDAGAARRVLEAALIDVGPGAVDQFIPMDEVLATQAYPFRVMLWVIGFLGGLALVLTATGIYGVMSYLVSQRTKEIGIRVALGADRWNVVKMVMRQSMKQAAVGAALGVAAALAVAPVFAHELAAVDPFEPAAYCSAVALVWLAAVAACYWPARRAAALDPLTALRCD